jgi:hypothetical protein
MVVVLFVQLLLVGVTTRGDFQAKIMVLCEFWLNTFEELNPNGPWVP